MTTTEVGLRQNESNLEDDGIYVDREGSRINLFVEPCRALNDALTLVNRARVFRDRTQAELDALRNGHDQSKRLRLTRDLQSHQHDLAEATEAFIMLKRRLLNLKLSIDIRRKLRDSGIPILDGYDRSNMPNDVRTAMGDIRMAFARA